MDQSTKKDIKERVMAELPPIQVADFDFPNIWDNPWSLKGNERRIYAAILERIESNPYYTYTVLLDSLITSSRMSPSKIEWTLRKMLTDPYYDPFEEE